MDSRLYGPTPWVATDRNQFKRREALTRLVGYYIQYYERFKPRAVVVAECCVLSIY